MGLLDLFNKHSHDIEYKTHHEKSEAVREGSVGVKAFEGH